ncbi:MAG: heavy metal translocating P-type ATPase, partial [Lachnospiraceae bacterium]|nr:heavy metal translocating P-type ATPase [Lachnospiraceae bacterium]
MNFTILHELPGRIRVRAHYQGKMSMREADVLQYTLSRGSGLKQVTVHERTKSVLIRYEGDREAVIDALKSFQFSDERNEEFVPEHTNREINREFEDKLFAKIAFRFVRRYLFPKPLRIFFSGMGVSRFVRKGFRSMRGGKLKVEALDAVAVTASFLRKDYNTTGSIMFLLNVGSLLEEWTHKKSVRDLAESMSLNIAKVWKVSGDTEELVPITDIQENDLISVRSGSLIPLDGLVEDGEAMVNQAAMTGESLAVRKSKGVTVYAGTAIEEGNLRIRVTSAPGGTRYEKVMHMIESSEKLKSGLEMRASALADKLVPYSFAGTILTFLLTRNVTRAISVLMVDFSCALKLSMPISVLSAMREAGNHRITVKGGRILEAVAEAKTIVFDKTGTLTKACPKVADVVAFQGREKKEMLRLAACLEEHFPHSIANAVVNEALQQGLDHEEMHSEVKYIVAHGIASSVDGEDVVIGSHHFVFEDEGCQIPEGEEAKFDALDTKYSHLYLAIGKVLAAVIYIEDPLREEAASVVHGLREAGFDRIVMMTGDSKRTAEAIASAVGVDLCYSEVLPEDKAAFIDREHQEGRKVIMVGDGINDSPALSASDAGIAISEGAQIAREVADVVISEDNLE